MLYIMIQLPQRTLVKLLLFFCLFVSCTRKGSPRPDDISGTWVVMQGRTLWYPYPSGSPYSLVGGGTSVFSTSIDSIKVQFDNNGNYTFWNYRLPADRGRYTVAQDSLLIIKPDTSDFVRYNFTVGTVYGSGGSVPPPSFPPYYGFQYFTDTLFFRKTGNNNLTVMAIWVARATTALPGNDTLLLYERTTYLRRQ